VLIVNADDVGASESTTDPAIASYDEGVISSVSAMVWMADSRRAAGLALERRIPVGLHLNLTLPFSDEGAPEDARAMHQQLVARFDSVSWMRDDAMFDERDPVIVAAIAHQLEAFRALYGEPTHLDGHHHVHVHPAVLPCLPREYPIRPVIKKPSELIRRRSSRDRKLRKAFRTADGCVNFRQIHPSTGGAGLQVLKFARRRVLDVMVHPQFSDEREALRTPEWAAALSSLQLGSYRGLGAR